MLQRSAAALIQGTPCDAAETQHLHRLAPVLLKTDLCGLTTPPFGSSPKGEAGASELIRPNYRWGSVLLSCWLSVELRIS